MNVPSFFDFRDPGIMKPQERFAEVLAILARGLGRYVDDLPTVSQPEGGSSEESAKVALNQLDESETKSVSVRDENA